MKLKLKINIESICFFVFLVYIFFSYIANDTFLPSKLSSYTLYLFLGASIFNIINNKKIIISHFIKWLIAFMIISLVSMLYSPCKEVFSGEFYFLIINLILVLFITQLNLSGKRFELISLTYAISSAILVILLILTGNMADSTNRLGNDLLGNANILAMMLMISTLYSLWLMVYGDKKFLKLSLVIGSIILNYYAMLYSGGRKYVIIPIIFLYILLLFKKDKKGKSHMIKVTILICIVILLFYNIIMNIPTFYDTIGFRIQYLMNMITGNTNEIGASANVRMELIQIGLKKIPDRPVLGHGFDSFKYYCKAITGYFFYSHNNFIELLYNQGIIGFLCYYYIYIHIIKKSLNKKYKIEYRAFALALILGILVFEYGAVNYTNTSVFIMFTLAYQMLMERYDNENIKKN